MHTSSQSTESSLWCRFRAKTARLRVGVLLEAEGVEAWLAAVLEALSALPEIEIQAGFVLPAPTGITGSATSWAFKKLESWSRGGQKSRWERSDPRVLRSPGQQLVGTGGVGLTPQDRATIAGQRLDLLLCATVSPLSGACAGLARLGVWSFVLGEPEFNKYRPPFWREVYKGNDVSRIFLLSHPERFERGHVIESAATATVPSLRFTENEVAPLRAAGSALGRALLKAEDPGRLPSAGPEILLQPGQRLQPTTMETAVFCARKLGRSATLRMAARGKAMRWFVGIRPASDALDLQDPARGKPFREIVAPPGHYFADPFVVERDGRNWLFVEDYVDRQGRARLACMELRPDGSTGDPVTILERPYHLSYPHVFCHEGEMFMIPETCGNADVQLYRATRFPYEWEPESVLFEGAELVDTTALFHEGGWYFFTSTAEQPEEAYLFTSGRIDGPWQYHPANPICTDTRNLRGAGAIFFHGGRIIRPVQDCSRGYGHAVVFNEILRLSPSEYEERQAGKWMPSWLPGLGGTHTFNRNSEYEVVDARQIRPLRD